jgi:predicted phage tail protein
MPSKSDPGPRMMERGLLCILIGAAVLIAPHFLNSPAWRETVAGASTAGGFAVALGVALAAVDLARRVRGRR